MVESPTNFKKQDKVQLIYIVMLAIVRTVYNGLEELVLGVRSQESGVWSGTQRKKGK